MQTKLNKAFSPQVLDTLTFEDRQQLLRLVVDTIIIENGRVRVATVIPTEQHNLRNRYHHQRER